MKIKFLLFVFILFFGQSAKKRMVPLAVPEKDHLSLFLQNAGNRSLNYNTRLQFARKSFTIVSKLPNDSIAFENFNAVNENFYNLDAWDDLKKSSKLFLNKCVTEKASKYIGYAEKWQGVYYENISKNDSAFYFYSRARKHFTKSNDANALSSIYFDQALVQYYVNDYMGAETSLVESLRIAKANKLVNNEFRNYCFFGINSLELNEFGKALQYHHKALNFAKENQSVLKPSDIGVCLSNIGYCYLAMGQYKKALRVIKKVYYMKSVRIETPHTFVRVIENLAYVKFKLNDLKDVPALFDEAEKMSVKLHIMNGRNYIQLYLSEYYEKIRDNASAIAAAQKALSMSKDFKAPKDILLSLKQLAKLDASKSRQYLTEYIRISDSMQKQERVTRIKFAKIAYETEEITREKNFISHQKWQLAVAFFCLIAILLLLFFIRMQYARQKELKLLQVQQSSNEEIYQLLLHQQNEIDQGRNIEKKRIAQELHDGVMNKLASMRLHLQLNIFKLSKDLQAKTAPAINDIQEIEKEIRAIAHRLNKDLHYDNSSFNALIESFILGQKELLRVNCHLEIAPDIDLQRLSNAKKIHVFRILQECFKNIELHASARNIIVSLVKANADLLIEIYDDGVGFAACGIKKGSGIKSIQSRAAACGGSARIKSGNGKGTTVMVTIPMNDEQINKRFGASGFKPLSALLLIALFSQYRTLHAQESAGNRIEMVRRYLNASNNNQLSYNQRTSSIYKAYHLLKAMPDDKNILELTNDLNKYSYSLNAWSGLKKGSFLLLNKSNRQKSDYYRGKAFLGIGLSYENTSINDSAFYFYKKAEEVFLKLKDRKSLCTVYQHQAQIEYYINDYLNSEKTLIKALQIATKNNLISEQIAVYLYLGSLSGELNDYDKAFQYYSKCLEILDENPIESDIFQRAGVLNSIGENFISKGNSEKALVYLKKGLDQKELEEIAPVTYASLLDNMGYASFKVKDFRNLPALYLQSAKIRNGMHIDIGRNYNALYLSEYYSAVNDTAAAIKYARHALELSRNFRAPKDMLLCLKQLSRIDNANTLSYMNQYVRISDSMQTLERKVRSKFAKIAFETEEITKEKNNQAHQRTMLIVAFICVLIFLILFLILKMQRSKQKELQLEEVRQKANEEIYNLMLDQQSKIDKGRNIEKKNIARELQHGVIDKLVATRSNLQNLSAESEITGQNLSFVDVIQDIENEIRSIAHDIDNDIFSDTITFIKIVESFIAEQQILSGIDCRLAIDDKINWQEINNTKKVHIFRILQEAFQNINKYANAKKVELAFTDLNSRIEIKIADNGRGFLLAEKKKGIGLQNIYSRAEACQGKAEITTAQDQGTTILITIPKDY